MEKHNNFRFNPGRYEDHLSELGRKVMNVLAEIWKSDQNRLQQPQHSYHYLRNSAQNSRVLAFRPSQISTPPVVSHELNIQNDIYNQSFDLEQNLHHHHSIPTTSHLVQGIQDLDNASVCISEDANMSSHDLINPVIEDCIPNGTFKEILDINDHTRITSDKDKGDQASDIDWDDMFDSELFSTNEVIENAQHLLDQLGKFPCEAKEKSETKTKEKCDRSKDINNKGSKKSKRKNQAITDAISKKVKKVPEEPKISFRKQKYTKTIKNWLSDVDTDIPVERNEKVGHNEIRPNAEMIIENPKIKTMKNVVQAQLANKDGIMKFRKPSTEIMEKLIGHKATDEYNSFPVENKIVKDLQPPEIINDTARNKNKAENCMNRVRKPKFVAPIKSQVPVKDVEFRVTTLEDNNVSDHIEMLRRIENQELVLVLIYSNGFCQLNNHHTEDRHDPDGFIISIDDDFLYFRGEHNCHKYKEILQYIMENNKVICYEGKTILIYFKSKLDLDVYKISIIDAEIGGSILNPDNPPENFSELQKLLSYTATFTIATECVLQKTAWYSTLLKECASKLVNLLLEEQLWNVFINIEMKLLPIIADMESNGVSIDVPKLKIMEDILLKKMKSTELECHKAAGKTFQINSPVQVRALIYDELKLDAKCNMKIRETIALGAKSTSESMLRGLVSVHPLPRLVLEYRHLHKAHATYLAGIGLHVTNNIVKPTWVQTAAATGRIASNNPNLQAIPKAPFNLVLFPGMAETNDTCQEALSFRAVYTARDGRSLLACDFKHVECRVFAHAAADDALLRVLRARGDLFRALAHSWLKKPESEVTCEDRELTKRVVYASLYGAGVRKLMDILSVGYEQALGVQTSFNRTFPSVKRFGQGVVARCAAGGGRLATLAGRVRRFANIASRDSALKSQAERQAVNFIIQGSAADICKMAMVEASSQLRNHSPPLDARLLLQIHDELVWEVKHDHLDTAAVIIKRAMEGCGLQSGMEDTLPVTLSVGKSWGEMTEYHTE